MESGTQTLMEQISKRETPKHNIKSYVYMPRIHEVQAPCQWLKNCYDGKCPGFVRHNGNFYCSKIKARI